MGGICSASPVKQSMVVVIPQDPSVPAPNADVQRTKSPTSGQKRDTQHLVDHTTTAVCSADHTNHATGRHSSDALHVDSKVAYEESPLESSTVTEKKHRHLSDVVAIVSPREETKMKLLYKGLTKFHAPEEYVPPIRLIDFDAFKSLGMMPRFPDNRDLCTNLDTIDRENSFIIFISHCWLRGWSGAKGWDGRPHPDNPTHDKYKLCVSGIEKMIRDLAPGMQHCYVWLDFGCMDQDGNPAGELKALDDIVRAADCLFTPIHGRAEVSANCFNYYEDYKVEAWNGNPQGYINRCWCRIEMFYAANIPLLESDANRHEKFEAGLRFHCINGVRPHLLYGTREEQLLANPIILPPLQNSYYEQLNPMHGNVTQEPDRLKIAQLVSELEPYMKTLDSGYVGDKVNDKMHGRGKYMYSDGSIYEGDFEDDKMHGDGTLRYANGDIYSGKFVDGKREGYGRYTNADGSVYEGDYVRDKRHGRGTFNYTSKNTYVGDWIYNKKQGKGVFTYANGDAYEGDFIEDKMDGKGILRYQNGDTFMGDFANGMKNGKGAFRFANGDFFEGDFVDDLRNGNGKFSSDDGSIYVGEFKNDAMHGKGLFKYSNGEVYDGTFVNNQRYGMGMLKRVDGTIYRGAFAKDRPILK